MSTKYHANADRTVLDDGLPLTDHAAMRYRQRTPHDCDVAPRIAWQRGEDIKHPRVCWSDGEDTPPERVRIYRHGQEWGVAFLVVRDVSSVDHRDPVIATVIGFSDFDHAPTRTYLHAHGPHWTPERGDSDE